MEILDASTTIELTFEGARNRRSTSTLSSTSITLIADDIVEDQEFFMLELSTDDEDVVLFPQNATIIITNNDRKINFTIVSLITQVVNLPILLYQLLRCHWSVTLLRFLRTWDHWRCVLC